MIFSHFTLSQQVLSESCTFCAITGKRKFAFSTVASFSRQKPLKSKNKNNTIVWNKKFYYCAKFELYRIKDAKVFPSMQLRALSWPGVIRISRTLTLTFSHVLSRSHFSNISRDRKVKSCSIIRS